MELVINISEEDYKECKFRKDLLSLGGEPTDLTFNMRMETAIGNGTVLPKVHGRLLDEDKLLSILVFGKHIEGCKCGEIARICNEAVVLETNKENK